MSLLFSFQGEEGPRGPPGEPGDKGDKVGDSCSGFPESFFFFFCQGSGVCKKKKKLFQSLNGGSDTDVRRGSTEADFFIFCRAAEVSRAHRVQLAKRERM